MRRTPLAVLLTLAAVLLLASSAFGAALQIAPRPIAKNVKAGNDLWTTPDDYSTYLDFSYNGGLPAGYFGPGSDPFTGIVYLYGVPLANDQGIPWNTDTVIERTQNTGPMAVGTCRTVGTRFIALHLQSHPFTVSFFGGAYTQTYTLTGGLSPSVPQSTGSMTICRTTQNGGTFTATLLAFFLNRYTETSTGTSFEVDCGTGACPEATLTSAGYGWRFTGTGHSGQDTAPAGLVVDVNANGIPNSAPLAGSSNMLAGVGGGGGGGGDECEKVEHVDGGGQDHSRPSHKSYIAGGDTDGSGKPDHCDCEEEPCEEDEEPIEGDAQQIG
ncbi:MAG: hypothetical protein GY719_14555 [bacterium]|nr:hypothetical protein [bacterium]